jgi:hypothetical protein
MARDTPLVARNQRGIGLHALCVGDGRGGLTGRLRGGRRRLNKNGIVFRFGSGEGVNYGLGVGSVGIVNSGSLRGRSESASSRDLLWCTRRVERHLRRAFDRSSRSCFTAGRILTLSSDPAYAVIHERS